MEIFVSADKTTMGSLAARAGADMIKKAILEKGSANIILATGASQFEMLAELIRSDIEWKKVRAFHLDEYIDLPEDHQASFRKYLRERFDEIVHPGEFIFINGNIDPVSECSRLRSLIVRYPVDVAFVGIGENGHLAFNDPPADFTTEEPYIVVDLDEQCRRQQMGEGWFGVIDEVPRRAISMSIKQIMKSRAIICTVPDGRKAVAVKNTLMEDISPMFPASILKDHAQVMLFLDKDSAVLLPPDILETVIKC
jgi:glucosamine-6-phosphate deaminase